MNKKQFDKFHANPSLSLIEAMQKIDFNSKGILFITTDKNRLVGSVTDGDIRRAIIRTGDLEMKVAEIMNPNPKVVAIGERQKAQDLITDFQLRAIAVVDQVGTLVDIIFDLDKDPAEENDVLTHVPVVIMAGGQGTRLYPFTKILPKPLIPIGDVPILVRIMDKFRGYGVGEFYISVNYKKNMIKSYLAEHENYKINFVEEDRPLGTAGSLKLLSDQIDRHFFVTNCDILIRANYDEIYDYHEKAKNQVTIITALKNIEVPYGVIEASANGNILALKEKPHLSYFVNTGMYVLHPDIFHWIPEKEFFHMTDLIDVLLRKNQKVGMYPISEDSFLDMGEWEELQRMEQKLKQSSN